ncbi:riboflavin synthase [Calorimonas adulescens]|uniref:Riboflavin synthase n=1 Tax=Calorimonas adulescens TaxID=2606906 RepID=A0A5D8QF35_9THEO|nr:riboflavin synthase [Calorimonas adulescens]TZE82446.1 riboflavin synthase [Calorimonas adulescens]
MFTGIVEEMGRVRHLNRTGGGISLAVECEKILQGMAVGDSIAVNGICLTATGVMGNHFTADVMPESILRSSLKNIRIGDHVNLERALPADGRFGGHIVAGHVDGTGTIASIRNEGNSRRICIRADNSILMYIVEKGSVALDGVSLTVSMVFEDTFEVSVIPHTLSSTTIGKKRVGDMVNIECDVIGKYIRKFLAGEKGNGLAEKLKENGYI